MSAPDVLNQEVALIVKSKPWLDPNLDPESWWVITSEKDGASVIPGGARPLGRTTVIDCLARVSYAGGTGPVFELALGVGETLICSPAKVVRAYRVLLVRDDDPRRAAYEWDQADVDEAFRRDQ